MVLFKEPTAIFKPGRRHFQKEKKKSFIDGITRRLRFPKGTLSAKDLVPYISEYMNI